MEISHTMLMAGLRDKVGPEGDVYQALREWQEQYRAGKMRAYEKAAERYFASRKADQTKADSSHAT